MSSIILHICPDTKTAQMNMPTPRSKEQDSHGLGAQGPAAQEKPSLLCVPWRALWVRCPGAVICKWFSTYAFLLPSTSNVFASLLAPRSPVCSYQCSLVSPGLPSQIMEQEPQSDFLPPHVKSEWYSSPLSWE